MRGPCRDRTDDIHGGSATVGDPVGKGGKNRTLPLHPTVAELAETMPRDGWWFPARGRRGGHVSGHSVSELITRAMRRAGITDRG